MKAERPVPPLVGWGVGVWGAAPGDARCRWPRVRMGWAGDCDTLGWLRRPRPTLLLRRPQQKPTFDGLNPGMERVLTSADDQSQRAEIYRSVVASILLVLGMLVGWNTAPDYYDCGRPGLVMVLLVGILGSLGAVRWARASRPVSTALFCVVPWSLGLAGVAYLGFLLLPLEVVATFVVLRRNTSLRGFRLFFASAAIRIVAFLPIVLCRTL